MKYNGSLSGDHIYIYEGFLAPDLCQAIINRFESVTDKVKPGQDGFLESSAEHLKSKDLYITHKPEWADIDGQLSIQMKQAIKLFKFENPDSFCRPKFHFDIGYAIQKTAIGDMYRWHHDGSREKRGSRQMTYVIYLNDVTEGGETEFLTQKLKISPKAGTMIFFPPYWTHVHRGCPPVSNDKYIITGWIYANLEENEDR